MKQLHKKLADFQIKDLMTRYLKKKVEREEIQKVLGIKKTRFFALIKRFKDDPENFSVSYFRSTPTRTISKDLVRTCYRKRISDIKQAQLVLNSLIQKYNHQWIHSTTGEIPYIRFQRALKDNRTLFRKFAVRPTYKSIKDIFCLRADRMVNFYRKISINNLELRVAKAPLHERMQLRITPDRESGLSEIRFWHKGELLGIQKVKNSDLNLVRFWFLNCLLFNF